MECVVSGRVPGGRDEVGAFRARSGGRRAELGEALEERGDDRAPLRRDTVGGVVVVPVTAAEREVAVEGIDQDLERLLERAEVGPLGGGSGFPGEPLGPNAENAEMLEQRRGAAQRVGGWRERGGGHPRRAEGR